MTDPCSLGCISKSAASRGREIIIPIHLRGEATSGRLHRGLGWGARGMLTNCSTPSEKALHWRAETHHVQGEG